MGLSEKIDVLIVSGARPQLLEKTLWSFQEKLFKNFEIGTFFVNLDLFGGGEQELDRCKQLVMAIAPDAVFNLPQEPNFTGAVKWLWGQANSPYCLHLEDDWLLNYEVVPDNIFPHFSANTAQVSFLTREKVWNRSDRYHYKKTSRSILGFKYWPKVDYERPLFTTSPCFMLTEFANTCSSMMDLRYDPEKQLYGHRNKPLADYTRQFRNYLFGDEENYIITDLGRDFRTQMGVDKKFVEGRSVWVKKN